MAAKNKLSANIKRRDFLQIIDDFALNVKNNTESGVSGMERLLDMKVIEALYKSLSAGGKRILI